MVKNLPVIQEAWVQSLGQEDPLEKGEFVPGEFCGQRSWKGYSPWDCKELIMTEQLTHFHFHLKYQLYPLTLQFISRQTLPLKRMAVDSTNFSPSLVGYVI